MKHVDHLIKYKGKLSHEINEAIRQAYLLDTVEACAYPNGYIQISRSSFKSNEDFEDYLAFVIGHEISHVLNEDSFNKSLKVSKEGKNLKTKMKIAYGFDISREYYVNDAGSQIDKLSNSLYKRYLEFFGKKITLLEEIPTFIKLKLKLSLILYTFPKLSLIVVS